MSLENQILALLAGQILTIFALLITNKMNRRHTARILRDKIQIEKRVDYLEKQLAEFYSPLYSLLKINEEIIKTHWDVNKKEHTHKVSDEIWLELRDKTLMPNNIRIMEILKKNAHLIEGPIIPDAVSKFIVHAEVWPLTHKYPNNFREYLENFSFPEEFRALIYKSMQDLKKEYYELIQKINIAK